MMTIISFFLCLCHFNLVLLGIPHVNAFMNTNGNTLFTKGSAITIINNHKLFSSSSATTSPPTTTADSSSQANQQDFFKSIVEDFCTYIPSPTEPSSKEQKQPPPSTRTATVTAPYNPNTDDNYNYYYHKINKNEKQRAMLSTLNDFETFLSSELHEINHQRAQKKQWEQYDQQRNAAIATTAASTSTTSATTDKKNKMVSSPSLNTKEYNELIQTLSILHDTYTALLKTRGSKHPRSVKTLQKLIQGYLHPSIVNSSHTPKEHFINAKNVLEDILQTKSKYDDNPTQRETQRQQIESKSNFAEMNTSSIQNPQKEKMKRIQQLYKNDFIVFQSLAFVYMKLSLYEQAKEMYHDVMYELQSIALGPYHPDTLKTLHHIANVYSTMNDYTNARKYYLTCYIYRKKTLGPIHEDTVNTLQALTNLYLCHGKYYQAYVLCEKCYTSIVTYGNTDIITPNTALMTFHNLALYYQQEGKLQKAKTIYEKCVIQQMKSLGGKDVDTLLTLHNLSTLYHDLGEYEKGIQTCQLCFMLRKDVLGLNHYDTIMTLCNLGMLYECQGKNSLAKSIYEVCLDVQIQTLGRENGDTLLTWDSLKRLEGEMGLIRNGVGSSSNSLMNGNGIGGSNDGGFTFGGSLATSTTDGNDSFRNDGEGTGVSRTIANGGNHDATNGVIRSKSGLQNGLKKQNVSWNDDDTDKKKFL